jgi:xylulokinase
MSHVLGIDLGLSSARAAVLDRRGRVVGRGRHETHRKRRNLEAPESLPKAWLDAAIDASRQAIADAGRPKIDAIGIGAFGPCPILLDVRGKPLMASAMFSATAESEAHRARLIKRHKIAPHRLGPDNTVPTLLWWRRSQPEIFSEAASVTDVAGFLVANLTGRAVMDPITRNDYQCLGLKVPIALPDIVAADAMAGCLTQTMASALGLPTGTPVTAGSYDSHVDIAGTGATRSGQAAILLGSTVVLGKIVSTSFKATKAISRGLRVTPHIGRGSMVGGWTSSSGSLLDWLASITGKKNAPTTIAPREAGLLVLPYFAGERAPVWDPAARGLILGSTLTTTRDDLWRATLDGIALSIMDIVQRLDSAVPSKSHFRAAGGGLRNEAWAQATADALGTPLEAMADAGEAIGPARLALRAIGRVSEPRIAKVYSPREKQRERYQKLLRIYRRLYPALRQSMHELGQMAEEELEPA